MTPDKKDAAKNGPVNSDAGSPESDYSRPTVRGKGMRTGYTTGACAAAATKAAVTALLTGKPVEKVTIHLPIGQDADFTLHRCEWIDGEPEGATPGSGKVLCSVIKDGGDDPDATHGAEICTTISLGPATEQGVTIKGGVGVGTVTFPGTGIPVGEPAVTRVPRRMIIESALEAGISSAGVDVRLLGPMPTPAIAYLTRTLHAQAGIVISASHNPYTDNGIKFFGGDGRKLNEQIEEEIERMLDEPIAVVATDKLGKVRRIDDARGRYIEFCKSTAPGLSLKGLKIVVDTANGAAYHITPDVFEELGATVVAIGNRPDGFNINRECGSTHPDALCQRVVDERAALGVALGAPSVLPAPAFALRLVLGTFAEEVLSSKRVHPAALLEAGYQHVHPGLGAALSSVLGAPKRPSAWLPAIAAATR